MIENSEKELLKEDLSKQESPEEIKKFIEDVEAMGENEDIVEIAKQKLEAILAKANTVETTSESQASQVENMGGTGEEVTERTKEVDQKIEEVKTGATKQIEEVKNIPGEELKEKTIDELEKEMQPAKDLDQLKKIKEHPDYNNLIQIATELRALHKVNKEKGSEEALQNYRRKEESLNKLVDKIAGDRGLSSYKILSASEILNIDKTINESGIQEKDEMIKNEGEMKTETQEKTTETQPEVKNTGMTEAEKEESLKYYNKRQEDIKKYDGLKTEELKLDGQLDYFFLKNDIPNFTKLLISKFEKEIAYKKLYIEELKEMESSEKPKNPSYNRSSEIRQQELKIEDYKERIEWAKGDVTRLQEYQIKLDGKGSSASENIKGLNPSQLAYKYYQEIKESISKEKERYSSPRAYEEEQAKYNNFHRFDKLDGLIDIAKQEKNTDLLTSIKGLNLELPEELKNKIN